ncbi:MAG TPA: TonB-dependent receptor plug domain-containing protein, partial [Steroidobacteraceae bacterium]|nr:TonB-dependent receptor plug domain-containing protein [Steroidobacteraceae bacterium]
MDEELATVTVSATGISNMSAASAGDVGPEQIATEPLLRPAAVLENIPGLIVTQHSGEGKANQYFLRAFNLDHGTDLALEVDDMPVNMPSHAHGQGYSDLNFLIPELTADLHYKKGPYYADEGDFATAGTARIGLLDEAPGSVSIGYGEDGYRRALLMGSTSLGAGSLLGAGEIYRNDGPFAVPDDYHRLNGLLRYRYGSSDDYYTAGVMLYGGSWTSTDQVPQRAVTEGLIGRFGSLNPTDGGETHRYSLSFGRLRRTDSDQIQLSAYVIRYSLDLWSTFTYFLKDPLHGDQMLQHDDRVVYGAKGSKSWFASFDGLTMTNVVGIQARVDDIRDVGIFPTYERHILGSTQDAGVMESSGAIYAENSLRWRDWLRTTVGIREDAFTFAVRDKLVLSDGSCNLHSDPLGCDTGHRRPSIFSPKMGIVLGPWADTTYFINAGYGYHSNDARGVTRSGQNAEVPPVTPLTRATSAELGLARRMGSAWEMTLDAFLLKLRSELVFDGDAGVTAPSGASARTGIEWGNTFHLNDWLLADLNATATRARFDRNAAPDDLGCVDAAATHPCAAPVQIVGRYIPNSPTSVIDAGLTARSGSGWFGSLRLRHFGESPLIEDN